MSGSTNLLIPSQILWRMAANALIYANKASSVQGYTYWIIRDGDLYVCSYDDYFAIVDRHDGPGLAEQDLTALLDYKDLQELEKSLRDAEGETDLKEIPWADPQEAILGVYTSAQRLVYGELLGDLRGELFEASMDWAVHPDRLRKLSLLHPRKGYPLSFRSYDYQDQHLLCFRYGPTVRGVISLLDESILASKFTKGLEIW